MWGKGLEKCLIQSGESLQISTLKHFTIMYGSIYFNILYFLLLICFIVNCHASIGDRTQFFHNCRQNCERQNCSAGKLTN